MVEKSPLQLTNVEKASTTKTTTHPLDEWDMFDDCIPQSKPNITKVCQDL